MGGGSLCIKDPATIAKCNNQVFFDRFWQCHKLPITLGGEGGLTCTYFKYHLISASFQIFVDLLQCTCSKPKNNFYILGPLVRILNVIQNPDSTKKFLAFLQSTLSKLILNWIHSSHVNRIIESILLNSARKILPPHPVSTRAILLPSSAVDKDQVVKMPSPLSSGWLWPLSGGKGWGWYDKL